MGDRESPAGVPGRDSGKGGQKILEMIECKLKRRK